MVQIITGSILVLIGIYVFYKYPIKNDTKSLALGALFIVVTVILKRLTLMVPLFGAESLKIGFELIPLMLAGMLLTPGYCFIIGVAVDLVGLLIVPTGFPFLGFTLNCVLAALIPSIIVQKIKIDKQNKLEIGIKIGLIILLVCASMYILSLDSITVSKTVITLQLWQKLVIIGGSIIMITILFIVMMAIKKKLEKQEVHIFYTWVVTVILVEVCISFLLTPYWLQIMYNIPFMLSLFIRIIKACIMIPLDICIGYSAFKVLRKI